MAAAKRCGVSLSVLRQVVCCAACAAGLPRPVGSLVVRHLRARRGARQVYEHRADGPPTPPRSDWVVAAVEPRRLPAVLHVRRAPSGRPRHRHRPLSVRQPLGRPPARVHLLGTHSARCHRTQPSLGKSSCLTPGGQRCRQPPPSIFLCRHFAPFDLYLLIQTS